MFHLGLYAFLAFALTGCGGPRYIDYFPYHNDGTAKPKVALMPIADSSACGLPWDLSREISEGLYYELRESGEIYVVSPREVGAVWQNRDAIDFFSNGNADVSEFKNTDFIVAMEIVNRSCAPCDPCTQSVSAFLGEHLSNYNLTVNVRIKVLDIRFREPKIILYEVFKTCYAGTQDCESETGVCWKSPDYQGTYCCRAHQRVIRNLARRLEEVIWSAK